MTTNGLFQVRLRNCARLALRLASANASIMVPRCFTGMIYACYVVSAPGNRSCRVRETPLDGFFGKVYHGSNMKQPTNCIAVSELPWPRELCGEDPVARDVELGGCAPEHGHRTHVGFVCGRLRSADVAAAAKAAKVCSMAYWEVAQSVGVDDFCSVEMMCE